MRQMDSRGSLHSDGKACSSESKRSIKVIPHPYILAAPAYSSTKQGGLSESTPVFRLPEPMPMEAFTLISILVVAV